ncbi:ferredoxin [Methylicorpusculum sp.]|uniref:ferredoxin n=1 Tax=Methylicorpusculum sp. TaxID=2713644 RepID=UPI003A100282
MCVKKIIRITIDPGCISCGRCQDLAPAVFEITDRARVHAEVDFVAHEQEIKEAARQCPVQVIKVQEG